MLILNIMLILKMYYPKETTISNKDPFTDPSKILPPYTIDQYRVKIFTNINTIP